MEDYSKNSDLYSDGHASERGSCIINLSPRDQLVLVKSILDDSDWEPNEFTKKVLQDYHNFVISK